MTPTDKQPHTGWMKLALRAQICNRCNPRHEPVDPHPCESTCALFVQLPRIARMLTRYGSKPPSGYEVYAINLLLKSCPSAAPGSADLPPNSAPSRNVIANYAPDALATLEKVAALIHAMQNPPPGNDCLRRNIALAQLDVHAGQGNADGY